MTTLIAAIATWDDSIGIDGPPKEYGIQIDSEDPQHLLDLGQMVRTRATEDLTERVLGVAVVAINESLTQTAGLEGWEYALSSARSQWSGLTGGHMVCVLSPRTWAMIRADIRGQSGADLHEHPVRQPWPVGFAGHLDGVEIWESTLLPEMDADQICNLFVWVDTTEGSPIRYRAEIGLTERRAVRTEEGTVEALVLPTHTAVHVADHGRIRSWVCPSR